MILSHHRKCDLCTNFGVENSCVSVFCERIRKSGALKFAHNWFQKRFLTYDFNRKEHFQEFF